MFESRLIANFRNFVINRADRDDLRRLNAAIDKYKYISFFSFNDEDDDTKDCNMLFIAFSNDSSTGFFSDNYEIRNLCVQQDNLEFYVYSDCAYHFPRQRIVVSTDTVERFYLEPVSWDSIFKAPKLQDGDWYDLSYIVFDYMNLPDAPYGSEIDCIEYLRGQTNITLDVVYRDDNKTTRTVRSTTLVRYNGNIVGVISSEGRRGSPMTKAFSTNVSSFHAVLDEIILEAGLDKYREPDNIIVLDLNKDCDSYFAVPGITPIEE